MDAEWRTIEYDGNLYDIPHWGMYIATDELGFVRIFENEPCINWGSFVACGKSAIVHPRKNYKWRYSLRETQLLEVKSMNRYLNVVISLLNKYCKIDINKN